SLEEKRDMDADGPLKIAVIQTPKISNFTDFDSLAGESDVALSYVRTVAELGEPDLILLPGSKNTTEDLLHLEASGMAAAIRERAERGIPVIGICGGYQMLGQEILDPLHTESEHDGTRGLGLLPIRTVFAREKLTSQVKADCAELVFLGAEIQGRALEGYEIHMGHTEFLEPAKHPFVIRKRAGRLMEEPEGMVSENGQVLGTYVHGIFDNDSFRRQLLNALRKRKGLAPLETMRNVRAEKQQNYERLAAVVREHLDMERLRNIMEDGRC
ncbi:MAG: cobyric acid synthase CobQ, partial [Selenomonadaceae bacterium]|nr:cobyric acid synthase CobQ [Selenomonadaceae bacterium]